jgi:hypothetical protein
MHTLSIRSVEDLELQRVLGGGGSCGGLRLTRLLAQPKRMVVWVQPIPFLGNGILGETNWPNQTIGFIYNILPSVLFIVHGIYHNC